MHSPSPVNSWIPMLGPSLVNFWIEPCKPSTNWMRWAGSSQQLRKICCTTPGSERWVRTSQLITQIWDIFLWAIGQNWCLGGWQGDLSNNCLAVVGCLVFEDHSMSHMSLQQKIEHPVLLSLSSYHARIPVPAASQESSASCGRKAATNKVRPRPKTNNPSL